MIEADSHGDARSGGLMMRDPRAILFQASQGAAPSGWAVFTKRRGRLSGFLRGTSDDPDPLLVITPEGVVEFVDNRKGLLLLAFDQLSDITLRMQGSSFSDSPIVNFGSGPRISCPSARAAARRTSMSGSSRAEGAHMGFAGELSRFVSGDGPQLGCLNVDRGGMGQRSLKGRLIGEHR
jgi:hypothetical protein